MSQRGRKPTPTRLKVLSGNPGKRPLNKNEPKPKPQRPSCPSWLCKDAKKEWRRVVDELEAIGMLTKIDMASLSGYCQAYARWKQAEEFIDKHGTVYPVNQETNIIFKQFPQVNVAKTYLQQMRLFCSEFGLTPSSRSRLNVDTKKEVDEFEEFLNYDKKKA
jgi:P27 family predicted phage terminase small subunit